MAYYGYFPMGAGAFPVGLDNSFGAFQGAFQPSPFIADPALGNCPTCAQQFVPVPNH